MPHVEQHGITKFANDYVAVVGRFKIVMLETLSGEEIITVFVL